MLKRKEDLGSIWGGTSMNQNWLAVVAMHRQRVSFITSVHEEADW